MEGSRVSRVVSAWIKKFMCTEGIRTFLLLHRTYWSRAEFDTPFICILYFLPQRTDGSAALQEASNKWTTDNTRYFELCVQRNFDPQYPDEDQHYQTRSALSDYIHNHLCFPIKWCKRAVPLITLALFLGIEDNSNPSLPQLLNVRRAGNGPEQSTTCGEGHKWMQATAFWIHHSRTLLLLWLSNGTFFVLLLLLFSNCLDTSDSTILLVLKNHSDRVQHALRSG